jgi:hypothetical protein
MAEDENAGSLLVVVWGMEGSQTSRKNNAATTMARERMNVDRDFFKE